MPRAKITLQQDHFCKEYLIDQDPDRSYRAAYPNHKGHTVHTKAMRLLGRLHIISHLRQLLFERSERLELNADSIVSQLQEVARRCMQTVPAYDRQGNPIGEYVFREQGAIRALELLGKHIGMFSEKLMITTPADEVLAQKLSQMSNDELKEFVLNVKDLKKVNVNAKRLQSGTD